MATALCCALGGPPFLPRFAPDRHPRSPGGRLPSPPLAMNRQGLQRDLQEAAALERRRQRELQRQSRIFNARVRTIGVRARLQRPPGRWGQRGGAAPPPALLQRVPGRAL